MASLLYPLNLLKMKAEWRVCQNSLILKKITKP